MIYLDNAATTIHKPPAVSKKTAWAINHLSSPGRGAYPAAMLAAEIALECRERACTLFHVSDPERVVFTSSATHGLNIALKTLAGRGVRVLISGYEHNSVTRPLKAIGARTIVAPSELFEPEMAVHAFESRLTNDTAVVVVNHVSNVFGYILPAERIAMLCGERGIPFVLDASQSAGTVDIDFQALGAAFVAMPGHKGLYGPRGRACCCAMKRPERSWKAERGAVPFHRQCPIFCRTVWRRARTICPGSQAFGRDQIHLFVSPGRILEQEKELIQTARDGLAVIRGVSVFSRENVCFQSGVLSFIMQDVHASLWAMNCRNAASLSEWGSTALRLRIRQPTRCTPGQSGSVFRLSAKSEIFTRF